MLKRSHQGRKSNIYYCGELCIVKIYELLLTAYET